jgi:hypothetical protein
MMIVIYNRLIFIVEATGGLEIQPVSQRGVSTHQQIVDCPSVVKPGIPN